MAGHARNLVAATGKTLQVEAAREGAETTFRFLVSASQSMRVARWFPQRYPT